MPVWRLLIVDDEAALRELLKRYLERLGYQVDLASTPADALACFEREPEQFSCVLTDLALPGMTGVELIERMRAHNPRLPALISSGYPYEPSTPDTGYLQKPYLPKMLADALEVLLGRQPDPAPGA